MYFCEACFAGFLKIYICDQSDNNARSGTGITDAITPASVMPLKCDRKARIDAILMTLVSVSNLDEVKAVVNDAMADRSRLEVIASGSKRALGRSCAYDLKLDLSAMAGIVDYQPEELVLTLRAGTPMAEVQSLLAGARQMLAFDVPDYSHLLGASDAGTIGEIGRASCRERV